MKVQEQTYRQDAVGTATALAPITTTEETQEARAQATRDKIAGYRHHLDEIELKRQKLSIVETYQWLWNIHEQDGSEIYDAVVAGHKYYDATAVRLIGSNPL